MKIHQILVGASILLIMTNPINLSSQCTNQVTHLSGSTTINGVNVAVTSSGLVDTYTTYCENTLPYFIGYHWPSSGGIGSYSFNFSPPVNSLTLNFSGISYFNGSPPAQEVIKIYINGSHYTIPSVGTTNSCDPLAMLTPEGDITGCINCGASGWNGTTITGLISSLTVLDTLYVGTNGAGSLFSLFICNPVLDGITDPTSLATNFYPNPFTDQITFTNSKNEQTTVLLYDFLGRQCLYQTFTNSTVLKTEILSNGIYFYEIRNAKGVLKTGTLLKQ